MAADDGAPAAPDRQLKLTYFRVRGRAELTRLVLAAGGVPYEDERISLEEHKRRKEDARLSSEEHRQKRRKEAPPSSQLPFGQLPTLTVGGRVFAQSYSIAKFAARLGGLMPKDPVEVLLAESIVDTTDDVRSKFVPIRYLAAEDKEILRRYAEFFEELLPPRLEQFEGLCPDHGGCLVGGGLTVADLAVFNMCEYLTAPSCARQLASPEHTALGANCLSKFPKLQKHRDMVSQVPGVKAWLAKRPRTPHDDVRTLVDADFVLPQGVA